MNDLNTFLNLAWSTMTQGIASGQLAGRLMGLSSLGLDGPPQSRNVVLRSASQTEGEIAFYTDAGSQKVKELQQNRHVAGLLWYPQNALQIRANGVAHLAVGEAVKELWDALPDHARTSYGNLPFPGADLGRAEALENQPDISRFAVVTIALQHLDIVDLDPKLHRRAAYSVSDSWKGRWLTP